MYKNIPNPKQENKEKIITALAENHVLRLSELSEKTGLSQKWITVLVKEKDMKKKITQTIKDGKPAYVLTSEGQEFYKKDIWHIFNDIKDWKIEGATYSSVDLEDGIMAGVIMDPTTQKSNILPMIPIPEKIESVLISNIYQNFKNRKSKLTKVEEGKYIIAFEFNFPEIQRYLSLMDHFIRDVLNNKNIFSDRTLDLNSIESKHGQRHTIVRFTEDAYRFLSESEYKMLKNKLAKQVKRHEELFSDVNEESLTKIKEDLRKGTVPDILQEIKNFWSKREFNSEDIYDSIHYYLDICRVLSLDNDDMSFKISEALIELYGIKWNIGDLHSILFIKDQRA